MTPTKDSSNPAYQVLARRYRSRTFDELIGQEAIAETLQNAIERGRTAHAYLFCGTRGVGKTSMARIFARALNATEELSEQAQIGDAILRGEDIDVIEIDAASNNGVADARELIANAGLMPARSPWKIYIIDEVHMLSTAAFNALLKTMEEPPAHVKFILCTTESHKVIPTIQSRCQRFDFRPIPARRIAEHLHEVLKTEQISAEDGVVTRIAQLANGSMRDGLSLLERLLAAADDRLDAELLERALGLVPEELLGRVVQAVAESSPADALKGGAALLDGGFAIGQALDALAERFRTLLAAGVCGADPELLGTDDEQAGQLARQAAAFQSEDLVHLISLCDAVASRARFSGAGRAIFDAAMVRMALQERYANAAALLEGGSAPARSSKPGAKKKSPTGDAPRVTPTRKPEPKPKPKPKPETGPVASPVQQVERKPDPAPQEPASVADKLGPWAALEAAASTRDQALLEGLAFERLEGNRLILRLRPEAGSGGEWVRNAPEVLEPLVERALGRGITFEILPAEVRQVPERSGIDISIRNRPVVKDAMDLFDASVIETRSAPTPKPGQPEDT